MVFEFETYLAVLIPHLSGLVICSLHLVNISHITTVCSLLSVACGPQGRDRSIIGTVVFQVIRINLVCYMTVKWNINCLTLPSCG